jgi:hypothetical protein
MTTIRPKSAATAVGARQHAKAIAAARVDAGELAFENRAALAEWLGTARSQVTRAAQGSAFGGAPGWQLAGLHAVVAALLTIYAPAAIPGWLHGFNPHLGDRRPIDVLASGEVASVMEAVQAARAGSYA